MIESVQQDIILFSTLTTSLVLILICSLLVAFKRKRPEKFLAPSMHTKGGLLTIGGLTELNNWYSADSFFTSSKTAVPIWKDQSGNDFHAVAPSLDTAPLYISKYVNNMPAIVFNQSVNPMMKFNWMSQPQLTFTVAMVLIFDTDGHSQFLCSSGPMQTGKFHVVYNSNERRIKYTVNGEPFTVGDSITAFRSMEPVLIVITGMIEDGTSYSTMYVNGKKELTQTTLLNNYFFRVMNVGNWDMDTSQNVKGGISELMCFNSELDAQERERLEGYLAWKWWGNKNTLYRAHPFKGSMIPALTPGQRLDAQRTILFDEDLIGSSYTFQITGYTAWTYSLQIRNRSSPDLLVHLEVRDFTKSKILLNTRQNNSWGAEISTAYESAGLTTGSTQNTRYTIYLTVGPTEHVILNKNKIPIVRMPNRFMGIKGDVLLHWFSAVSIVA